jgi:hypothetical protein
MKKKLKKYQGDTSGSQVSKTPSDTTRTSASDAAAKAAAKAMQDPKVQAVMKKVKEEQLKYTPPKPKMIDPDYGKLKIKKTGGAIKSKKKK